jgi:hypothetical protein
MTRTVNGERLFDDRAKEILRKQLWQLADYCGVQILTYAILSNHFHVLLAVPTRAEISDAELLRRYAILYPKPTPHQTAALDVIKSQLATDGPEALAWRQLARHSPRLCAVRIPLTTCRGQRVSAALNRASLSSWWGRVWGELRRGPGQRVWLPITVARLRRASLTNGAESRNLG